MSDGKIIIDTSIDNSGAEKGLNDLSKKANEGLKSLNKAFLVTSAVLAGVGAASIKVGSDFEAGMSEVKAISGASAKDMELLCSKAKEMGATTKFSATESSEALKYMAMAGWKTQQMLDGLPGIMNLAAASGEDLALTSDIVTDALTAFGMKAEDAGHFADVLASASSNSNTNVAMLGESFKYVAPLAGSLGYSAEDTSIALGLMANSGIKASQAGTSLKTALVNMAKPTQSMEILMDAMGISLTNTDGTMKSLGEVMDILRESMGGLDEATQANAAATLFGKESLAGMLAIINASPEDYAKLTDAIYNADGATEQMANEMNNNLKGSLTLMKSALEGLGIAFYEKFSGPAKEVIDNVGTWFGELTQKLNDGELDNTLSGIATSLAVVGTGLLVFNVVSTINNFIGVMNGTATAVGLVAKAFKILDAVMAMSSIGWIIIGISAVVAGLIVLWNTNEGFRNAVIGAWNAILSAGQAVWGWIVTFFTEDIPNAWQGVLDFFSGIPQFFSDLWELNKQAFIDGWNAIVAFFTETIPQWIENIGNWFNELPGKIGYALGYALGTIIKWGADSWNYLVTNVPIWIENVGIWFSELPGRIWTWLCNSYEKIKKWGSDTLQSMKEASCNAINAVIEWFSTLPSRLWEWLCNTATKVNDFASDLKLKATEAGINFSKNLIEAVKSLPGKFMEIGKHIVTGVWDGIVGAKDWINNKICGFFGGLVDGAKDALGIHSPSRVFRDQVGKYMAQGVGVGFENEVDNIESSMKKDLSSIVGEMQMAVDYNVATTTAGIVARNNRTTASVNNSDSNLNKVLRAIDKVANRPISNYLMVDGREAVIATAPFQDEWQKYNEGR